MKFQFLKRNEKAVALVTVLLIISMLSILVLTFFSTMRVEHRSSVSFADTQRAKMVAQGAVAHAIEILRTNIPEPAGIEMNAETAGRDFEGQPGKGGTATNWSVNPGQLTLFNNSGEERFIPLHTGGATRDPASTGDPDVYSVDLNEPIPGKFEPAITYAHDDSGNAQVDAPLPEMRVEWVNILEDPSRPASEENQIVARHAFWIDDECGKINFNTALGKPARSDNAQGDQRFWDQFDRGYMGASFQKEATGTRFNEDNEFRGFALGHPRSVNLDTLFESPFRESQLNEENLMAHAQLRGFSRYPEAILDHLEMDDVEKRDWFERNRYDLTFYSRAPEFNAFGRPRLMTTKIPLSLEGGPYYQLPFVYNGSDAPSTKSEIKGVLHLHGLLGSFGFSSEEKEVDGIDSSNAVNRAQVEILLRYFDRKFPGYRQSFMDVYGEDECVQMALNMLAMGRMATTGMNRSELDVFTRDYMLRSTSVSYVPNDNEREGENPERFYWRFQPGGSGQGQFLKNGEDSDENTRFFIPNTHGPYITEVQLTFIPQPPPVYRNETVVDNTLRVLGIRFDVEYYMPGIGPWLEVSQFPMKIDYLKLDIEGGLKDVDLQMGPKYTGEPRAMPNGNSLPDRNWNHNGNRGLGSLHVVAEDGVTIRPTAQDSGNNRKVVRGPVRHIGSRGRGRNANAHPNFLANRNQEQTRLAFSRFSEVTIDVAFRGGMGAGAGVNSNSNRKNRPRQMFPLGEGLAAELSPDVEVDVLKAENIRVPMSGGPVSVSWQINDPRLSHFAEMWKYTIGSDPGTLGAPNEGVKISPTNDNEGNSDEPPHDSDEKSKFKYLHWAHRGARYDGIGNYHRWDEYATSSRVASKGYWSVLPTRMHGEIFENPSRDNNFLRTWVLGKEPQPWETIKLSDEGKTQDWLLMDLLGSTYPMQRDQWRVNSTTPDEFSTISFLHSTTGAINVNTKPYPDDSNFFDAPQRVKPLKAVFKELRSDNEINDLIGGIQSYQDGNYFKYLGELGRVPGYSKGGSRNDFENEELLRNMIGCLTTKSNTFGVWGVGQVVRKVRREDGSAEYGEFEDGDSVRSEKRFYALIERYIWPGIDGVPGNAHVSGSGRWDRIAQQSDDIPLSATTSDGRTAPPNTLFQLPGSPPTKKNNFVGLSLDSSGTYPEFDGPQRVIMDRFPKQVLGDVEHRSSRLEDSYNPPQPVIKYKVVYFKYLDE